MFQCLRWLWCRCYHVLRFSVSRRTRPDRKRNVLAAFLVFFAAPAFLRWGPTYLPFWKTSIAIEEILILLLRLIVGHLLVRHFCRSIEDVGMVSLSALRLFLLLL